MAHKARQLEAGRADVNLETLEVTITREKMAKAISEVEAEIEASPEDAALQSKLDNLRKEDHEYRLISSREFSTALSK